MKIVWLWPMRTTWIFYHYRHTYKHRPQQFEIQINSVEWNKMMPSTSILDVSLRDLIQMHGCFVTQQIVHIHLKLFINEFSIECVCLLPVVIDSKRVPDNNNAWLDWTTTWLHWNVLWRSFKRQGHKSFSWRNCTFFSAFSIWKIWNSLTEYNDDRHCALESFFTPFDNRLRFFKGILIFFVSKIT